MNIFLTGGAGYIGSAATEILLQHGHNVTVYDSLVTGYRAAVPKAASFIEADLADQTALASALGSDTFDAVMHFAAFIEAGESMQNPGKYFHNNVVLSLGLIEACHRAGVPRFVLSSSAAVYASSDEPLSEDSPLDPANVYGQTKWMIEQSLEWYRRIHGLRYAALRYFNAAGALPGRGEAHRPESHLIPLMLQVALGQHPEAEIFGTDYPTPDGTGIRDYIHVEDLASAHLKALEYLRAGGASTTLNCGYGHGYSVREVLEAVGKANGAPLTITEEPRRAGDPPELVAVADKVRSVLGWTPRYDDLDTIVRTSLAWERKIAARDPGAYWPD